MARLIIIEKKQLSTSNIAYLGVSRSDLKIREPIARD
jgi:hypothetical protein